MKTWKKTFLSFVLVLAISLGSLICAFAVPNNYYSTPSNMTGDADGTQVVKKKGKWCAVYNGTVETGYTGIAKNKYGWWRVTNGYVDFNFTGIAQNEYGWWRVEEGKVNFRANGVYPNEYGWWRVENGKVNFKANGIYKNDYGWWKVKKGKVDFKFTGIASNSLGYWYVRKGKVDFTKNGTVDYDGTQWTVTDGKAVGEIPAAVLNAFYNGGADDPYYMAAYNYCIAVNTAQNLVVIYGMDEEGNYVVPVKAFVASCGKSSSPTKTGTFQTIEKYKWRALNGGVYGQYATRITGQYLFHSVPYYKKSKSTLETAEYNKLGSNASAGCVRLSVANAKWIYDNCPEGTIVTIYSNRSLREPFVKPQAIRINANDSRAGWDPTDPDASNPWL